MERQVSPEIIAKNCLFGEEDDGTISWQQHFSGNFDELLKAECRQE